MGQNKTVLPKGSNETRVTTFSILLKIVFEVLARKIRQEKELRRTQAEKEAVIFSLCAGGILMISATELEKQNPKVHVEAQNTQNTK